MPIAEPTATPAEGAMAEDARNSRDARRVHLGVAIAAGALLGFGISRTMVHGVVAIPAIAVIAAFGVAAMGVIASSRIARGAMLVLGFIFLNLLEDLPRELALQRAGYGSGMAYSIVAGATALLYVVGTVLANFTPSAWRYHRANEEARAERKRRKARSLTEWRRGSQ